MSPGELRAAVSLAAIFGLRLFGMFIILPVFALYAETLPGGRDHTLVGLALGAYGLTQALLQIPFGWASDRWGRKPVIVVGLLIFALGSFLAGRLTVPEDRLVSALLQMTTGAVLCTTVGLLAGQGPRVVLLRVPDSAPGRHALGQTGIDHAGMPGGVLVHQ